MISIDEAVQHVLRAAQRGMPERVAIGDALGRTLAEDVASDIDSPPHDKALMDGYAVRSADFSRRVHSESPEPIELAVVEEITAGNVPTREVRTGGAARVMTGAPIPDGADAVVMVERTEWNAEPGTPMGVVRIDTTDVPLGLNIMPRATSLRRGQVVLGSGTLAGPAEIGLLAEVGRAEVQVIVQPTVAVLATGNELVESGIEPGPGKIRNSNGPMLLAFARRAGAKTIDLGIGRDDPEQLGALIDRGLTADVLVLSGGVSAGRLDLVPEVLARHGVRKVFHKVALKPGKPIWFGVHTGLEMMEDTSASTLVFGLPGNPVGSLVCFELFVARALRAMAGRADDLPRLFHATLERPIDHHGERPTYHPARVTWDDDRALVDPIAWHGSGDLRAMADANAFAIFPSGDQAYGRGDRVGCQLFP